MSIKLVRLELLELDKLRGLLGLQVGFQCRPDVLVVGLGDVTIVERALLRHLEEPLVHPADVKFFVVLACH